MKKLALTLAAETCEICEDSLDGNSHGFDQNDGYMDGDKLILYGTCTYCRICFPRSSKPAPDERLHRPQVQEILG